MSVLTRAAWNELLDTVNDVLQNPPGGCDPLPPIPHVGQRHRWSKADIRTVQDKLKATCESIAFDPIPERWRQATIDEINEKLGEAWCDCDCDESQDVTCEYPAPYVAMNFSPECSITYKVNDENVCAWSFGEALSGMQVGQPGYSNRLWLIYHVNGETGFTRLAMTKFIRENGTQLNGAGGVISCDGLIENFQTPLGYVYDPSQGDYFQVRLQCSGGVQHPCCD